MDGIGSWGDEIGREARQESDGAGLALGGEAGPDLGGGDDEVASMVFVNS